MICYNENVVKMLWMWHLFCTITLFLVVVGSNMIFYYFILTYKKLIPQQL